MTFELTETISTEPLLMAFEGLMLFAVLVLFFQVGKAKGDSERIFQMAFISFCGRMAAIVPSLLIGCRMVQDAALYHKFGATRRYPLGQLSALDIVTLGTPIIYGVSVYCLCSVFKFIVLLRKPAPSHVPHS